MSIKKPVNRIMPVDATYLQRHEFSQHMRCLDLADLQKQAADLEFVRGKFHTEMNRLSKLDGSVAAKLLSLVEELDKRAVDLQVGIAALSAAMRTAWGHPAAATGDERK